MMTKVQAEALAALTCRLRDDWDHPGVMAAIHRARDLGAPAAIAAALCNLAGNPDIRTPGILPEPGKHWGGTTTASRRPPTMCGLHPTERAWDCRPCTAEAAADPTPGLTAIRQSLDRRNR